MPELARGLAATLFERLSGQEAAPQSVFLVTEEAVRASIVRELSRLFNTRRPQQGGFDAGLPPTVLDYGIPDFTGRHTANPEHRDQLAADMTRSVAWFEPRLREPLVKVLPPRGAGGPLIVQVSGQVAIGQDLRRVEFDMDL